jgi:hypothetical protein
VEEGAARGCIQVLSGQVQQQDGFRQATTSAGCAARQVETRAG